MKKFAFLFFVVILFSACGGNKNILHDKMAKYPYEKYITKVASASEKKLAKESSLKEMKNIFNGVPASEGSEERRTHILSLAKTVEWWKAPDGEDKYYALSVLERAPALEALTPYYTGIDAKLKIVTDKISSEQDKFVRLKYALSMPELFDQREKLDSEYRLISYDASSYNEDMLYNARAVYNKTFYDVKISASITGDENEIVKTSVIEALNTLGFQIGEELPSADIALTMKVVIDKYDSTTLKGLYWSTASATVSLKDLDTAGIFSTFSKTDRAGSARLEEAQRRSLVSAGQKCSPEVKEKVIEYLKKK